MQNPDKQVELRERGAEFSALRAQLAQAAQLPIVAASAMARSRVDALNTRAGKLQTGITQVGKMIDGARRWFADTFSLDLAEEVPIANTGIDAAIQSSIAGMNYFIRDAKAELARIAELQKIYDAATEDQKRNILTDLKSEAGPVAAPALSQKTILIMLAAAAALWWVSSRKGEDHGDG